MHTDERNIGGTASLTNSMSKINIHTDEDKHAYRWKK